MIRLAVPSIDAEDLEAVRVALASGYLVQGPRVAEFEREVAAYIGVEYAVAVSNGTAALHLALLALGVTRGDRVAVTTYSWPATANVIELCGATPVFIDIETTTYGMDPAGLEAALAAGPVKAVLPVHPFGGLADMPAILAVAERHGVPVVEDAACALGTELDGRRAGAFGTLGCFSFHPRKAITTGEGGIVSTNDPSHARVMRALRNHGQDPEAPAPDFVMPGFNLRLTEFQAALGSSQLRKLERLVESRRAQAARYDQLLADTALTPPGVLATSRHVYQSYVALLPAAAASRRGEIIAALRAAGVETTIGTYHMPMTTWFRQAYGFGPGDFPVTDDVAARAISLPLFEALTPAEQRFVVGQVNAAVEDGALAAPR